MSEFGSDEGLEHLESAIDNMYFIAEKLVRQHGESRTSNYMIEFLRTINILEIFYDILSKTVEESNEVEKIMTNNNINWN